MPRCSWTPITRSNSRSRCSATWPRRSKPTGLIGIVEFTKDGWGPGPAMDERIDAERVMRDAEAAGLQLVRRETFLRYQYLLVFGLPNR